MIGWLSKALRQAPRQTFKRMSSTVSAAAALSWKELDAIGSDYTEPDRVNGPTNAQSRLRLFGKHEVKQGSEPPTVGVTLYRDNHAWCPYCQKVWLWLEEMQVPYRIEKVTMFCYGEKEAWFKRIVPSGMLPAVKLEGKLITESDDILVALERRYGPLRLSMKDSDVAECRALERTLFRGWCTWLCSPQTRHPAYDARGQQIFEAAAAKVEAKMNETKEPFFLGEFSTADIVLAPYIERMNASLYYYKGYTLRSPKKWPGISRWFDAMETRAVYRGTQSDFHTHCHDLPPQMGGCYSNGTKAALANQERVDRGPSWSGLPDCGYTEPSSAAIEALSRVLKHRDNVIAVNPAPSSVADAALRSALTRLVRPDSKPSVPKGGDIALRYIRDRVNVPRDMSIHAARRFRAALEATAATAGDAEGPEIPVRHRRDQDPRDFARS